MTSATYERISAERGAELAGAILQGARYSDDHANLMARNMLDAQAQECHSHGLYRLIDCSKAANARLVVPAAEPVVRDQAGGLVRADACGGNSLLAFMTASDLLVQKARDNGIAALAINNCFHYTALWWEVEHLSQRGIAALAMTPTNAYVAPFGGTRPLLGTNPLAFSWPRPGNDPYTFDFATSVAARGEVEIRNRRKEQLPPGWAIDAEGRPTTDPQAALAGALLTFGGHKGSAISTMIELLAGPLIGDLLSHQMSGNTGAAPAGLIHGELILALDPERFGVSFDAAETLFAQIVRQGARLPSERRRAARNASREHGLLISSELLAELDQLALSL